MQNQATCKISAALKHLAAGHFSELGKQIKCAVKAREGRGWWEKQQVISESAYTVEQGAASPAPCVSASAGWGASHGLRPFLRRRKGRSPACHAQEAQPEVVAQRALVVHRVVCELGQGRGHVPDVHDVDSGRQHVRSAMALNSSSCGSVRQSLLSTCRCAWIGNGVVVTCALELRLSLQFAAFSGTGLGADGINVSPCRGGCLDVMDMPLCQSGISGATMHMICAALPCKPPTSMRAHWTAQLCSFLLANCVAPQGLARELTQCTRLPSALAAASASARALTLSAYCSAVHARVAGLVARRPLSEHPQSGRLAPCATRQGPRRRSWRWTRL